MMRWHETTWRGIAQLLLGSAQAFAATLSIILILRTGVNELSAGVTCATLLLLLLSRVLFGKP